MTVKEIRRYLERALDKMSDFDEDDKIVMVTNTYHLGDCHVFLGVSGFDGGYINLEEPEIEEDDDWDEEDADMEEEDID